jgi:hypothetical protein
MLNSFAEGAGGMQFLSFFSFSSPTSSTYTALKGKMKISQVIDNVKHAIGAAVFDSMVAFVKEREPNLWESEKPTQFLIYMVALTIYKDLYNERYKELFKKVELGYKSSHKSLNHNSQVIRKILGEWELSTIQLGNLRQWKNAAMRVSIPKELKGLQGEALLWRL